MLLLILGIAQANNACQDFFLKGISPEHTITQLDSYIKDNLGAEFVEKAHQGKKVFIVLGDGYQASSQLTINGFAEIEPIKKEVGFHQTWKAQKNGEEVLVITRVNGRDRVAHMESFFDLGILSWYVKEL